MRDRNASYETARRSAGADLHGPPELTAAGQRARQRLSMSAVRFGRRGGGCGFEEWFAIAIGMAMGPFLPKSTCAIDPAAVVHLRLERVLQLSQSLLSLCSFSVRPAIEREWWTLM